MVNNYSNILSLLQSKIDESIDNLSDSKIKSPNDYILNKAAEMLRRYFALNAITLIKIKTDIIKLYS